jgi:excinuclease UvrABC nuclease subunit
MKGNEKPNTPCHSSAGIFQHLRSVASKLPLTSGIYLMRGERGEILYIGKAKSLRKRALSYFKVPAPIPKIAILMQKVQVDLAPEN